MKILFSLTYYTPYISGLTLYVKRLAEELSKESFQCSVVSFRYESKLKEEGIINGVQVYRAKPLVKISKGFISLDWMRLCWTKVKNNDCLVVNLPHPEGLVPVILAKFFRKKIISVYNCEVVLPPGLVNRIVERVVDTTHKVILNMSDVIVTYTEDYARYSKVLPSFGRKLQYMYPPVKKPVINKRVQNLIGEKIRSGQPVIIGVAARLAAEKGIEYLLEAIPLLNRELGTKNKELPFKIVIAGPMEPVGEEYYRKKIMKLVEKYKEYVIFLGNIDPDGMGSFYSFLDVLVLPSINSTEAFGMVQVEAMMMGVPVVATDLPGVRVPVQKTGMGKIVPIKNSRAIAEAIIEVLHNRKKYKKDRKRIEKEFAIENTVSQFIQLVQSY